MINLIIGRPEPIGQVFCTHSASRILSFTGSTEVGKILMAQSAPHLKRLAMELGGNAPFIVLDDADLPAAADALISNKFRCAGQTCVCTNRVLVHRSIEPRFTEWVADRVRKLRVGNGLDPVTDIGPLINRAGWDKVRRHVSDALQHGAQRIVGQDRPRPAADFGAFFDPTVLTAVRPDMLVSREETFGPVVAIGTFDTDAQAIDLANGTPFGLASYVFGRDPHRLDSIVSRLRFGHVGVNTGSGPTPEAPFGGMKSSGFSREGGLEGLLEYTDP